jgi:hypothetical protein
VRVLAAALALLIGSACFGPDPNLTPSGAGLPGLAVDFPARAPAGSTRTARFTITNPGPEAIASVVVAFARVGPAHGGGDLPTPIVDGGFDHQNPAVRGIRPRPRAISRTATEFFFGSLDEGETTRIEFDLLIPDAGGEAANSVTVYDGSDPDRIRGARLSTAVGA